MKSSGNAYLVVDVSLHYFSPLKFNSRGLSEFCSNAGFVQCCRAISALKATWSTVLYPPLVPQSPAVSNQRLKLMGCNCSSSSTSGTSYLNQNQFRLFAALSICLSAHNAFAFFLQLKSKRSKLERFTATIHRNFFLILKRKSYAHQRDSFNGTVSCASILSSFPSWRCEMFCARFWQGLLLYFNSNYFFSIPRRHVDMTFTAAISTYFLAPFLFYNESTAPVGRHLLSRRRPQRQRDFFLVLHWIKESSR